MQVPRDEAIELARLLWSCGSESGYRMFERETALTYIAERPYLIAALGFDEVRTYRKGDPGAEAELRPFFFEDGMAFRGAKQAELVLRDRRTRDWYRLGYVEGAEVTYPDTPLYLWLRNRDEDLIEIQVSALLEDVEQRVAEAAPDERALIWPAELRLSLRDHREDLQLSSLAADLIRSLHDGAISLEDLSPGDFEDVIAELARGMGLAVDVGTTKRTRDGGRDLVVAGELLPGVRARVAIEVTTQSKVDIDKVAPAIAQNRHFPQILVISRGQYAVRTLKLQQEPDLNLRLQLASAELVSEWVARYARRRGWGETGT